MEKKIMKVSSLFFLFGVSSLFMSCDIEDNPVSYYMPMIPQDSVKITKIWDNGKYCAFTSLIKYDGKYYCAFREGIAHCQDKGLIRILVSQDANDWRERFLLSYPDYDLRDPNLSVTPDGRLMLLCGRQNITNLATQSVVSFWDNSNESFCPFEVIKVPKLISEDTNWIWRATWVDDICYAVRYGGRYPDVVKSKDGVNWSFVSSLVGNADETQLQRMSDGRMVALIRTKSYGKIGYGNAPYYNDWNIRSSNVILQGMSFLVSKNDKIVCVSRSYNNDGMASTSLYCSVNDYSFAKLFDFPSGGDTSYAGIVLDNDKMLISYYSSHERPAVIYLAEIPLQCLRDRGVFF